MHLFAAIKITISADTRLSHVTTCKARNNFCFLFFCGIQVCYLDGNNMIMSPGMSRRVLLVFITGTAVGFFVTYLFTSTSQTEYSLRSAKRRLVPHEHFIPQSPHNHGETDDFIGPDQVQQWSDEHSESHHHHGKYYLNLGFLKNNLFAF